jgi:hypothetical protein
VAVVEVVSKAELQEQVVLAVEGMEKREQILLDCPATQGLRTPVAVVAVVLEVCLFPQLAVQVVPV